MSSLSDPASHHAPQAAAGDTENATPRLESLPPPVLDRCLRSRSGEAYDAAFATCTSFAKALLSSSITPNLLVRLGDRDEESFKALLSVLRWADHDLVNMKLRLFGPHGNPASLQPLLTSLQKGSVGLEMVKSVTGVDLVLDAHLAAILPNLKTLWLDGCSITVTLLPLAGCSQLTALHLSGSSAGDWLPQLQQLTSLPTLSSLHLTVEHYPTSFLPLLAGQLTQLELSESREVDSQGWEAALSAAAQCSSLRNLDVSDCTGTDRQLKILRTLTQLEQLTLGHMDSMEDTIGTLLQFLSLTHLSCKNVGQPQQTYADSPCSWKQLGLGRVTPQLLSRLPLHSLTKPLQLAHLYLNQPGLTVADVRAAADNVSRIRAVPRVIHPCAGEEREGALGDMMISFGAVDDALLVQAAAALVPSNIKGLLLYSAWLDAELVSALQEAVPGETITRIELTSGWVEPDVWVQLGTCFA